MQVSSFGNMVGLMLRCAEGWKNNPYFSSSGAGVVLMVWGHVKVGLVVVVGIFLVGYSKYFLKTNDGKSSNRKWIHCLLVYLSFFEHNTELILHLADNRVTSVKGDFHVFTYIRYSKTRTLSILFKSWGQIPPCHYIYLFLVLAHCMEVFQPECWNFKSIFWTFSNLFPRFALWSETTPSLKWLCLCPTPVHSVS